MVRVKLNVNMNVGTVEAQTAVGRRSARQGEWPRVSGTRLAEVFVDGQAFKRLVL